MSKVMLVIRDGWGYSPKRTGNAILNANTPFDDWLSENSSSVLLACHGEKVGLPPGFQGSSEVGHLNMGAGRVVEQEVTRIFKEITTKTIFNSPNFQKIRSLLQNKKSSIHLFGLLQDEGVHAHQEHLFELYHVIRSEFPNIRIWIHPVADGRDTPPQSFSSFFKVLLGKINSDPLTQIGTVWGRYYGMDRSRNWNLIQIALNAMLNGDGLRVDDFLEAVQNAYDNELTPDQVKMSDEYLKPLINKEYPGINQNDVVINFNYRQDRAIQISQAFTDPNCPAYAKICGTVHYFGLTRYCNDFKNYLVAPMDDSGALDQILGEVLSLHGKRQLRIAETQKFRHVTSFFNGKSTEPFPLEEQIEIPSQWDPSSFARHPEMNAADVTQELLQRLLQNYDFIVVNYANCDMVGHTGDYEAAIKAVECVDSNVAAIVKNALDLCFNVIVTADHGNSEEMLDEKGAIKTSHTINPVKLHLISPPKGDHFSFKTTIGVLSDIAPLILKIMKLPIPKEMTSRNLVNSTAVS